MTQANSRRVRSLAELAQSVPPNRDLWPAIAAAIESERSVQQVPRAPRWGVRFSAGLAASVALIAVGFFVGRELPDRSPPLVAGIDGRAAAAMINTAFDTDPKLRAVRTQLFAEAQRKLAELPQADRERVAASLAAIRRSMKEIEAALGRDPTNALLQELLVNAYQEEMRVLTTLSAAHQEA